ncbi:MAG: 5-methyltetrahydrofolate--homocysteine methyltransferase [Paludibacter sp.]|nr:5-methyltetrahydrofolate--homocysteine methyltransferase [Paludibacter sp.]
MTISYQNIPVNNIIALINWTFFFKAWQLAGAYNEEKEAQKQHLQAEANVLLQKIIRDNLLKINAFVGIFPAHTQGEDIIISTKNDILTLPMLRQQHPSSDGFCYSLCDFLNEKNDEIGVFAISVHGAENLSDNFLKVNDNYNSILIKTIADRLAEASAEYLHYLVRTQIWNYSKNEIFEPKQLLKNDYQGIRPAVGYPSLPDQSIIFDLDKIINFSKLDIKLTQNGAMFPNSSACGLYFSHPKSKYFMIGKIDETQLADYAFRRGKSVDEMRKWLAANL